MGERESAGRLLAGLRPMTRLQYYLSCCMMPTAAADTTGTSTVRTLITTCLTTKEVTARAEVDSAVEHVRNVEHTESRKACKGRRT